MRIYQNIAAMNAYRNLATTENRLNKSLERLSSGLRINRAADDAAGLAISEKMRAQIRGLNQAVRNAQDGISLIQTAEGALNETHSILQRMRELAVQAATGTNTSQDRMEIQREVDQLKTEIDRIANTTEFNTKKLLDGTTAALTSTDKLSTKVFMRDGLRVVDQFGQKAAGGGNYKIEITPDPGLGQVLKTDIMKIKHGTDYTFDAASGLTAVSAENLRYGSYTMATTAGPIVSAGADHTGGVLFAGYATSSLDLAISGSTTLSGSFGVKITNVDYQAGAFDYELLYRFYDETGNASEGSYTGTLSAGTTHDIGGSGVLVEFTETDITQYKTNEVATYYVNMGNDGAEDIVVDNVSISSGAYNTSINGVVYTAHATNVTTISMEAGLWNDRISDFDVVQIDAAGNLTYGNARLTFESLVDSGAAVTFEYQGEIGQRATLDSTLHDLDRFWDTSGNFILENPQTLTLVQGDGAKANVTIFRSDTIFGIQEKLNAAIGNTKSFAGTIETGKGLGQSDLEGVSTDYTKFVQYVTHTGAAASGGTGFTSVQGTYVIQSAITGRSGEIYFVGNDAIIDALSLTTIQHSKENNFQVSVYDAHDRSKVVAQDVVINGNLLVGVVHANVDVEFHNNTGINTVWNDDTKQWEWQKTANLPVETFVHLADNTSVFHIGANPLQDVPAAIGDMRSAALGVDNILVTGRELANSAISKIDLAIQRVSSERSKMGALQNRLEHTISNLSVAAENLAASESRIRDLDMAKEMMEFTKNQILMQAGTAMLAQANMKPQSVLQLLG